MSAAGRNKPGKERDPLDYYPTPAATTRAILPFLKIDRRDTVFDPACGDGAILNEVRTWYGCDTMGIEIDSERARAARDGGSNVFVGDALKTERWGNETAAIIGNPPFGLAMEFVERSMEKLEKRKFSCWLLPLDFIATAGRRTFNRKNPADFYVLTQRPSFTNDGDTDMRTYAWLVWPGEGRWRVL